MSCKHGKTISISSCPSETTERLQIGKLFNHQSQMALDNSATKMVSCYTEDRAVLKIACDAMSVTPRVN